MLKSYEDIYAIIQRRTPPKSPVAEKILNIIKRIRQMSYVQWTTTESTMPYRPEGYYNEGEQIEGLNYSSARGVGRWVGFDVSLETFMTAVRNPKSILYTEDLREEPYNVPNSAAYYGMTCSNFVCWGYDFPFTYTSGNTFDGKVEKAEEIEPQNAENVKLADAISTSSHMEIVTDKTNSNIEVTDIGYGGVRVKNFSHSEFNNWIGSDRKIVRFEYPEEIKYEPSPFINLEGEDTFEYDYNEVLMLDRGNKTNYRPSDPVKINIMDSSADTLVVKRDGVEIESVSIDETGVVEKNYSELGHYEIYCMMEDNSESDKVEFILSEVNLALENTEVQAGEDIIINFTAEKTTPQTIQLQTKNEYSLTPGMWREITQEEIDEGQLLITHNRPDDYYVNIRGINDFRITYSEFKEIKILE